MTREQIAARVRALGPWFHNQNLAGVETAPDHYLGDYPREKWRRFEHAVPADLTGQSVLDVGCNGGFYALEMKARGAARVVGIDHDEHYLAQARFAAEVRGLDIELRRMSVYDVGTLGERFDLVIFMGVLYHLRHPLLALDRIRRHVVGRAMLFQSMIRGSTGATSFDLDYPFAETDVFASPDFPKLHFIEHAYAGDDTNWWIPNRACVEAMLRSSGFEIVDRPEAEVFLCRPSADGAWNLCEEDCP
ncbi:MAG: TIGR04290 family methyltransferase [Polyangiaceae bacterium]|nr:TIGR04290 family methyltransferase [Polyangiaceae bacterium]